MTGDEYTDTVSFGNGLTIKNQSCVVFIILVWQERLVLMVSLVEELGSLRNGKDFVELMVFSGTSAAPSVSSCR